MGFYQVKKFSLAGVAGEEGSPTKKIDVMVFVLEKLPLLLSFSVVIQIWLVGEAIKLSATALVIPVMATKLGIKIKSTQGLHTLPSSHLKQVVGQHSLFGYHTN
jgi:hypothetical protein